jgi:hypothetical protein
MQFYKMGALTPPKPPVEYFYKNEISLVGFREHRLAPCAGLL